MQNSYTSIFLRTSINISDTSKVDELIIKANFDDGFILWINGIEIMGPSIIKNGYSFIKINVCW